MKKIKKIKGDASFRSFYRKESKNFSSIIVLAKKEKFKNLVVYDAINKILIKNNILAPCLYNEYYNQDHIEIQDFGNDTIFKLLRKKNNKKFYYFKKIIKLLNKMQSIKDRKIKNFKNKNYKIPTYEKKILINEANLFCDWYIKKNLPRKNHSKFSKRFKKIVRKLTSNLKLKNNVFVHRDFHVSNLMLLKNQVGIIDSQDALIGNPAYDLVSLIDDVRFKTSKLFKDKLFNFYIKRQKKYEIYKFKNDFQILSILRNLKIIGIFSRLAMRDKKKGYLKLIPHAWELLKLRIKEDEIFDELKELLTKNFKKKI